MAINWTELLIQVGIVPSFEDDEFQLLCPFHADEHNSMSINTRKGKWICYRGCGGGDLKYFFMKYKGLSDKEAEEFIGAGEYVVNVDVFDDILYPEKKQEELPPWAKFPYNQNYVPPWIFKRGYDKNTLKRWGCGITAENGLAIPVCNYVGEIYGYVIRRDKGYEPKYLYSKGLHKSELLFGQHLLRDRGMVCVTEGSLDTMWLDQLGYNSVALLGMSMSFTQADLLMAAEISEIVLCLDNDEAGRLGTEKALTRLGNSCKISYITLPDGIKDVQDIPTKSLLDEVINDRNYW